MELSRWQAGQYRGRPLNPRALMPYKANEPRRHKIPKARYKIGNWAEYDTALRQRGSLTVWVTPEAIAAWAPAATGRRGWPRDYSDVAIDDAAPSVRPAVAPDRRHVGVDHRSAWPGIAGSGPHDGRVVNRHTPIPQHQLEIAIGDRKLQIP